MKYYIVISLVAASVIVGINLYSETMTSKAPPIPPAPELVHAHMGYKQTLADAYWLRFLQSPEFCGFNESAYEDSFSESNDGKRMGPNRTPSCRKGWGYSMIQVLMGLAPRFHFALQMAPITLSVVADDIEGASELFKATTRLFPNDWKIQYDAGYHFMVELEDYERAARLFQNASLLGAPRWVPLLVARLHTKAGQNQLAEITLRNFLKTVENDDGLKIRAEEKLRALKEQN